MPRAYAPDLRARVLAASQADHLSHRAGAARCRIGESTVRLWLRRVRETGAAAPKPHAGGARSRVDAAGAVVLEGLVEERAARTLAELADAYRERTGVALSTHAVWRQPRAAPASGSTCGGKTRSLAADEQTRADVGAAREAWAAAAPALRSEDLVCIDESGITTTMARRYGRAQGGRRARGAVPAGPGERLTVLGGLARAGLVACLTIEGAADAAVLVAFARHVLVPALRPGQVVVLDNLAAHKAPTFRRLIERAGCTLRFLPPYSPDLNPIEPAWSKLKTLLRGIGARTVEALDTALTTLVDRITAEDAAGYFRHCGYGR